jgi:hypothetical protein
VVAAAHELVVTLAAHGIGMRFIQHPVLHHQVGDGAVSHQSQRGMHRIDGLLFVTPPGVDFVVKGNAHSGIEHDHFCQVTQGAGMIFEDFECAPMIDLERRNYVMV